MQTTQAIRLCFVCNASRAKHCCLCSSSVRTPYHSLSAIRYLVFHRNNHRNPRWNRQQILTYRSVGNTKSARTPPTPDKISRNDILLEILALTQRVIFHRTLG
ncbi:hypothetical protein CC86DRAFT_207792 [Ophiobolus disseminans]|uniref:Uncharacterized protein n=1 Tax=Ophiobolus disseminans TaxID=1469910 RepID=A0A6A7A1H4_9PLEO|nr:hypothetical protein CC86DRAFT_207792 [Ophiobolus disseminans]